MNPFPHLLQPGSSPRRGLVLAAAGYIVLWLALWYLAKLADVMGGASLWFLPAGLRFCAFVLFGWPALLLELATTGIANSLQFAASGPDVTGLLSEPAGWRVYDWCGLPLAYAMVLFPLRGQLRDRIDLARPAHSLPFIGAACAAGLLGALVGTVHLVYAGIIAPAQWSNAAAAWFTGDFIGIITLAPLLLVRTWPRLAPCLQPGHEDCSPKGVSSALDRHADLHTVLAAVLALALVFGVPKYLDLKLNFPLVALSLLFPLAAVAMRYGLRGAVLAVALLDGGLVLAVAVLRQQELALQYQIVMIGIATVGLWLGGAVESRNRLLASYNGELLAEVAQQTLALELANRELAVKEQHLRLMLMAAPVGVLEFDGSGRCSYLNDVGCILAQCNAEQAQGRHFLDFVHSEDREKLELAWNADRHSATVQLFEFRLTSQVWCVARWINLQQVDAALDGAIVTLTDMTVHHQHEELLWDLGHHDALTSLPNRKLFMDRCAQALSLARRRENGAALLWIDLDGFKAVNDSLGHAAGDALLQQVALRLKSRIRDSDTLARLGGDEFAVIMPDVKDQESVVQVASELVASLGEWFELPQGRVHISASMGIALYPQHADNLEALMQCADMAMYSAKRAGKNQVQLGRGEAIEETLEAGPAITPALTTAA